MNDRHIRKICGPLLGVAIICGCNDAAAPARIEPVPQAASNAVERNQDNKSIAVAAADQPATTRDPHSTVVARLSAEAVSWELNPPKSVTAEKNVVPHDSGAMFMRYCSVCHGPFGRGDGQYYSDELPSKPANLADQTVLDSMDDEHLVAVITGGSAAVGKSPLCPPWGRVLSKEQVAELVTHIRILPTLKEPVSPDDSETAEKTE